jgi:alkylation response protein AidB-like acyl-CoA dehydrogenase
MTPANSPRSITSPNPSGDRIDAPDLAAVFASQLGTDTPVAPGRVLDALVAGGHDKLPLPGAGQTLERWRRLARVAACDLSVAKLFESHTDALAIMAELGVPASAQGGTWGVWAADPPDAQVTVGSDGTTAPGHLSQVRLNGKKAWCSGAEVLSHALLTARDGAGSLFLVAVSLRQPGVHVDASGWRAVGMAATVSAEVGFDDVAATVIGAAGAYLDRPGFWHGGAGIAACWHGAAAALGDALRLRCRAGKAGDPHVLAHLGEVDVALTGAAHAMTALAGRIDADPANPFMQPVVAVRLLVEAAIERVIHHTGRALGAGPYCRDPHFARLMADLPVFVRQSHAERDLAFLGELVRDSPEQPWVL